MEIGIAQTRWDETDQVCIYKETCSYCRTNDPQFAQSTNQNVQYHKGMISMKIPDNVTPEGLDGEIQYINEWVDKNQVSWSPAREIKMLKAALKKDYLYNSDELRKMKTRLRHMTIVRAQLKKGPGFGK